VLVLLDRDGVINHDRADSVKNPDELVMIEGSARAVARLNAARHQVVIVTNQSIIGRGTIDQTMLDRIHEKMTAALARENARIDRVYICPDAPWEATERRKPGPGMLYEALSDFAANAAQTPFIGDSLSDLQAGQKAGCQRILVRTGKGADTQANGGLQDVMPVRVHEDLSDAVAGLLGDPS
jgi:D-glycero-D-manno-heptose 1,7-bisphosphate phosphatase